MSLWLKNISGRNLTSKDLKIQLENGVLVDGATFDALEFETPIHLMETDALKRALDVGDVIFTKTQGGVAYTINESLDILTPQNLYDSPIIDATAVEAAGAVMETDTSTVDMSFVIDEDNMVSNSDTKVPTQQSVKQYVDGAVAGGVTFKGDYDAATNTPDLDVSPSGIIEADMYAVIAAGNFFTAAVEVGDVIISKQDNPTLESHWTILQKNLDAGSVKTLYESNANTNAYTDAEQTAVASIGKWEYRTSNFDAVAGGKYIVGAGITVDLPITLATDESVEIMAVYEFVDDVTTPITIRTVGSGNKIRVDDGRADSGYVNSWLLYSGERVSVVHSDTTGGNDNAVSLVNDNIFGERAIRYDGSGVRNGNFSAKPFYYYRVGDNGASPVVISEGNVPRIRVGCEITIKSLGTLAPDISAFNGVTMEAGELVTLRYLGGTSQWVKIGSYNTVQLAANTAKLNGIEDGATTDQTGSEIVIAINNTLGSTDWQIGNPNPGAVIGDIKSSALTEAQMLAIDSTWVPCDGRVVLGTDYAALTGNILAPDLRGQFLRGLDPTGLVDPDGAGRTLLDSQADELKSHSHTYSTYQSLAASGNNQNGQKGATNAQTGLTGGAETRPKNVSINFFIKVNA